MLNLAADGRFTMFNIPFPIRTADDIPVAVSLKGMRFGMGKRAPSADETA